MGLDMYLTAKRFLWTYPEDSPDSVLSKQISLLLGVEQRTQYVIIKAGYWRKANHIHGWFVTNVQDGTDDCARYDVTREQLVQLHCLCQEVLADNSKAAELLPLADGFFFGGREYEQWYSDDLVETINIIDEALKLPNCWDFTYQASW